MDIQNGPIINPKINYKSAEPLAVYLEQSIGTI